jgi:muconolactone delta-isomerase
MKVELGWVLLVLLVVGFIVWRLSALAGRLDRLHHRIDLARGSLDAQLVRRARAAEALGSSGLIDPASAIVLAQAASHSRNADPEEVAALRATPDGQELVDDLARACSQVALSRRFLNDGIQAVRLLRQGRLVRLFRLAGSAPRPEMFEMDDVAPPTFAAFA